MFQPDFFLGMLVPTQSGWSPTLVEGLIDRPLSGLDHGAGAAMGGSHQRGERAKRAPGMRAAFAKETKGTHASISGS